MESKNRWSQLIAIVIAILSLVVLVVSVMVSVFYASKSLVLENESKRLQQAAFRPVLVPNLVELSYDNRYVKIVISIANRGPTTAVIREARITTYDQGGISAWIKGFERNIVYPGRSRQQTFKLSRQSKISIPGATAQRTYDPGQTITTMGNLPLLVAFTSQQLPGVEYTEQIEFTALPWHNKTIIGVGD